METAHIPKQWMRWIQMMMRGDRDSATQYDLRGNVALTRTDAGIPTMNFGYWHDVAPTAKDALWAATQALFQLVGETAALSERDAMVLDAGCGFGTNARYLAETFGVQRVVGLNVSSLQLEACRQIARGSVRAAAINFARGSATCMPFADATFDKVVSVEAAFHFPPRQQFFAEAFRVLRPGGTLALADLVGPAPQNTWQRTAIAMLCRALQIPHENIYDLDVYRQQLADCGFVLCELRSIREDVLTRYQHWLFHQPVGKLLSLGMPMMMSSAPFLLYPWDYICLKAIKR